jgi:kynurenine 3-monooxygenase
MLQRESIPMKGRMIHHVSPDQPPSSQIYDPRGGQVGYSLSRPILNQRLVEALPSDVKIRFKTKLSRIDLKKRLAWGIGAEGGKAYKLGDEAGGSTGDKSDGRKEVAEEDSKGTGFDLVVGADGSWSKTRSEMMRVERYVSVR